MRTSTSCGLSPGPQKSRPAPLLIDNKQALRELAIRAETSKMSTVFRCANVVAATGWRTQVSESFDDIIREYISFVNEQVGMYMDALAG